MAFILNILRAILRALGLLKPASSESSTRINAAQTEEISSAQGPEIEFPRYPYRRRDDFLSLAERNFFGVLYQAVGGNAVICVKVNLADLFYVPLRDPGEHRIYTNKIDRKHVDFVLCDPQTLTPRLGIELDDRSHDRADRQQRDHFVSNVFAEAGLPLLRVKVQPSYTMQDLAQILHAYLEVSPPERVVKAETSQAAREAGRATIPQAMTAGNSVENALPPCPKCGNAMVLRAARGGANAGQRFWGCINYPRRKAMLAYAGV